MTPRLGHDWVMTETADVIVVGAGVQGASLAFHLRGAASGSSSSNATRSRPARPGARPGSSGCTTTSRATPVSRGPRSRTSSAGRIWSAPVTAASCRPGSCSVSPRRSPTRSAPTSRCSKRSASTRGSSTPAEVGELVPGAVTDDIGIGASSPRRAMPTRRHGGGVPRGRRADGARFVQGCRVTRRGGRRRVVVGVETDRGRFDAPVVVDVAGAWAAGLAGRSASRCRSRRGGTTLRSSACLPAAGRTSRSSSTRSTRSYFRPEGTT